MLMAMTFVFLCGLLVTGQAPAATPPPLTAEQITLVRDLVRATQANAERLRQQLAERERELAGKYAAFDLDEAAAEKLQGDIVDLQKRLLANYHHLQVELRKVVGAERFAQLKQRLDNVLRPKPKADPKPSERSQ